MSKPPDKAWMDLWCTAHNHLATEWVCQHIDSLKKYPGYPHSGSFFVKIVRVDLTFDPPRDERPA